MARRRGKRTTVTAANLFAATLEAQWATWVTLGVRVPQLLSGTMTAAERRRMVAEKADAAAESARASTLAAGRLMCDPATLRSRGALMAGLTDVSAAAARPFQKRVKANARRLGGRPRRGSG